MEVDGFEDYIDDAYYYKGEYDSKSGNLMSYYGIKTEAQILSECITKTEKSFSKKWDRDAIGLEVKSLKKKARRWFDVGLGSGSAPDKVYAKASAWYHVTYHPDYWGCYNEGMNRDHYLSFPWCIYDKLVKIKKDKSSIRRSLHLSSLERQFADGLTLG
ncbi:probable RNA-dependent RNA polymerase 1 [Macadamia integrifolia]|uniref:probable RNA-dependent RNA polymerase 1 n=1 Tax=Macadamia integrifolia TaxID=60698 RepID=UPI001C4FF1C2|nr:probable RNA-dependent RNA polymerase 1 [Macadamia integrifolia]